jgi:Cof subfamily protein (haloacid dehalogenase superfamily)
LDGTFLNADSAVSPLNQAALRRAVAAGVTVVFATGRPARWLEVLEPLHPLQPLAITSNGAVIFNLQTGQIEQVQTLPFDDSLSLAADLIDLVPDAAFAIEYTDGWGRQNHYPLRGDYVEADRISDSIAELLQASTPIKLILLSPSLPTDQLAELVAPRLEGRLDMTFSFVDSTGLLELAAPGVSKASALRQLMAQRGIAPSEVVAFGDMPNDLPMLDLAGFPFAMANAHPQLLAQGYPTAGHHDDSGVGRTMMALMDQLSL